MINSLDMAALSYDRKDSKSVTGITRADCKLFAIAYGRGKRRAFWSRFNGENCRLKDLARVEGRSSGRPVSGAGIVTVAIARIVGSEGRADDFDSEFSPLAMHNRSRWLGIAAARRQGRVLPPVELIQVGDVYYVRDGHHRISVAKAAGQQEVEARVVCVIQ
jgi:hypothetical protein